MLSKQESSKAPRRDPAALRGDGAADKDGTGQDRSAGANRLLLYLATSSFPSDFLFCSSGPSGLRAVSVSQSGSGAAAVQQGEGAGAALPEAEKG